MCFKHVSVKGAAASADFSWRPSGQEGMPGENKLASFRILHMAVLWYSLGPVYSNTLIWSPGWSHGSLAEFACALAELLYKARGKRHAPAIHGFCGSQPASKKSKWKPWQCMAAASAASWLAAAALVASCSLHGWRH